MASGFSTTLKRVHTNPQIMCKKAQAAGHTITATQVSSDTPATLRREHGDDSVMVYIVNQNECCDSYPLCRSKAEFAPTVNGDCGNRGYPQYVGTSRSSLTAERGFSK